MGKRVDPKISAQTHKTSMIRVKEKGFCPLSPKEGRPAGLKDWGRVK